MVPTLLPNLSLQATNLIYVSLWYEYAGNKNLLTVVLLLSDNNDVACLETELSRGLSIEVVQGLV